MPVRASGARHTVRDLLIYVGVGIAVVGLVSYVAVGQARAGGALEFPVRWIFLGAETALVFGYVLRVFWGSRRRQRFWLAFVGLLAIHMGLAIRLLAALHSSPPMLLLSLLCPVEYFVISFVLLRVARPPVDP